MPSVTQVYWQAFAIDGSEATPPAIASVEEAKVIAGMHKGALAGSASALLREGAIAETDGVSIATVARLGAGLDPAANLPRPLYLRGPMPSRRRFRDSESMIHGAHRLFHPQAGLRNLPARNDRRSSRGGAARARFPQPWNDGEFHSLLSQDPVFGFLALKQGVPGRTAGG